MIKPNHNHMTSETTYLCVNHDNKEYTMYTDMLEATQYFISKAAFGQRQAFKNLQLACIANPAENLTQTVILTKAGNDIISAKCNICPTEETIEIFKYYAWKNPSLKFMRCPECGNVAEYKTVNEKHVIACTTCKKETYQYTVKNDALEAWCNGNIHDPVKLTPAHKEIEKWLILANNDDKSNIHHRFYIGEPNFQPNETLPNNWKTILKNCGYEESSFPKSPKIIAANAEDYAEIFDFACIKEGHMYLKETFIKLHKSLKDNMQAALTDEQAKTILADTFNSFKRKNDN